jgi:hypothetical protein
MYKVWIMIDNEYNIIDEYWINVDNDDNIDEWI